MGLLRSSASALFRAAVAARTAGYDRGLLRSRSVPGLKVVSVGNICAGGSGKTPMTLMLARLLLDKGERPVILSRGYRGSMEEEGGLVSGGDGPLVSADKAGDEAFMLARKAAGISVRVGANRLAQARLARDDGATVAVLDDGFQHRRIERDLDIVLVSPEDLRPDAALLPAGHLRESRSALARAHLIAGLDSDWSGRPDAPPLIVRVVHDGYLEPGRPEPLAQDHLSGARVILFCGIARPERFSRTAEEAGVILEDRVFFPDHHRYTRIDLLALETAAARRGAAALLTTEKDLARMDGTGWRPTIPLLALRTTPDIAAGEARLVAELSRRL